MIGKTLRFIIAGGTATAVNLLLLYLLTHFFGVWYLAASVAAFLGSFLVSFVLQKFWAFRDRSRSAIRKQAGLYFLTVLCGLAVNTLFVYLFVEYLAFAPLVAQIVSSGLIAVGNYFVYQNFIFDKNVI